MELPFCKICGERHRLGFCPEFGPLPVKVTDGQKSKAVAGAVEEKRPRAVAPDQGRQGQQVGIEARPVPAKPKFDRKAYQRELMRKRRAAAKAKR